eukprot:364756-Chlamydomonas_euryale.AAC.4
MPGRKREAEIQQDEATCVQEFRSIHAAWDVWNLKGRQAKEEGLRRWLWEVSHDLAGPASKKQRRKFGGCLAWARC